MKKLIIAIAAFASFSAHAQKNTLLEQSFWKNKPDVTLVKAEVEKGNSPSQLNGSSFDPVVMAINADAPTETIIYLLSQPGNEIAKLTHDGRTYMHWAANRGNVAVLEYLSSKGAKAIVTDSHGSTPLNFAAGAGQQNTKIYDICLASGANLKSDLNNDGANALLLAISNDNDLKLTDYFVSKGLSLKSTDAAGNNAFAYAAKAGNIEMLKTLLKKGIKADPNAMIMASIGSRRAANTLDVYQYLESLNIKPATSKQNVLHALVRKPNQNEIIKYFLSKGVDVNQADEDGNTVVMNAAATNRDPEVLALLLPHVKNINQANQSGVTALAMAILSNSTEVVNLLLAKGADVNVTDNKGNNLAFYLIESFRPLTGRGSNGPKTDDFDTKLKALQDKGFNVTQQQKNGNTLYHIAVSKGDISLLKRLAPLGVDINAKNEEGITVLHKTAMISKDDEMLKYLLSVGAKKDAVTDMQETAFDLATENETLAKNNVSVDFLK